MRLCHISQRAPHQRYRRRVPGADADIRRPPLGAARHWIPARPCGPSGMTSKEGHPEERFTFTVIPGRAQREPGIQRHLRDVRLDSDPALCAVRDDVERKGLSGMAS